MKKMCVEKNPLLFTTNKLFQKLMSNHFINYVLIHRILFFYIKRYLLILS